MDIGFALDPQRHLAILFIGDCNIDELHQLAHHLDCRLAVLPQILPVIEIAGDSQSLVPRLANGFQGQLRR